MTHLWVSCFNETLMKRLLNLLAPAFDFSSPSLKYSWKSKQTSFPDESSFPSDRRRYFLASHGRTASFGVGQRNRERITGRLRSCWASWQKRGILLKPMKKTFTHKRQRWSKESNWLFQLSLSLLCESLFHSLFPLFCPAQQYLWPLPHTPRAVSWWTLLPTKRRTGKITVLGWTVEDLKKKHCDLNKPNMRWSCAFKKSKGWAQC